MRTNEDIHETSDHLPKILIVEDDVIIAHALAAHLTAAGFAIVGPCSSVQNALKTIASTYLDGAVLDLNLQYELSTLVADALEAKKIPFFVCSGSVTRSLGDLLYPRTKVLQKPVAPELVVAELAKIIRGV